jgi:hypothetical protein
MDPGDDPAALIARSSMAAAAAAAEDWAAGDQYAALLPDLERVLGADHPETLAARRRHAALQGDDGEFEAARQLFAALVPDLERVLGAEHPDTLAARLSLAEWTGMAGFGLPLVGVRRILWRVTLRVQRRLFWGGRCRCGGCTNRAAARDQLAALLPDMRRVLGADHPDTLAARWGHAMWTAEAGDAAAGRDLYAALLPDLDRVLGADHPTTQSARKNLEWSTRLAEDESHINGSLARKRSRPGAGSPFWLGHPQVSNTMSAIRQH